MEVGRLGYSIVFSKPLAQQVQPFTGNSLPGFAEMVGRNVLLNPGADRLPIGARKSINIREPRPEVWDLGKHIRPDDIVCNGERTEGLGRGNANK